MSEIKTNKISPRKGTTQTIGDSGDTVTIASGATLSNAGTISGIQKIDWDTTKKTSAFTAVNQTGYFVDTSSAAITVTFPTSPSAGNVIGIKDYANTFDTNNLTIDPNGNKIQGSTENFIVSVEGTAANFIYVDATRGWVLTDASKASDVTGAVYFTSATGGTITTCGDFKIHTFTGPGTFTVTQVGNAPVNPLGGPNTADYLVLAGGGGGGSEYGGGGGAGGYRGSGFGPSPLQGTAETLSTTSYPITVGSGGASGGNPREGGAPGNNSIFSTITSAGGGGGGKLQGCGSPGPGQSGGSGGGGTNRACVSASPGGTGNTPLVSPPQGSDGGSSGWSGGGGGGITAAGANTPLSDTPGGNGGAGAPNTITGTDTTYSGGGGGGGYRQSGGSGGAGGGGNGGGFPTAPGNTVTAGSANTGGGGGGGSAPSIEGGAGGSGIVIIRYKYQ